MSKSMQVKRLY